MLGFVNIFNSPFVSESVVGLQQKQNICGPCQSDLKRKIKALKG